MVCGRACFAARAGLTAGSFGGDADGAVARQNGTSTWSYQSCGVGGPGAGGAGAGAGLGGSGPFVHVVHLGSFPCAENVSQIQEWRE